VTDSPKIRSDEILDLRFLFSAFWRGRWLVLIAALVGLGLGINSLTAFQPRSEAYMLVLPYSSSGGSGNTASGAIGGIARSLGVSLADNRAATNFDRLELIIGTVSFAEMLDEEHGLIRKVFASQWDENAGKWRRPEGRLFEIEQNIRGRLGLRQWSPPNVERLANYLRSGIVVEAISETSSFHRISHRHPDAKVATEVLHTVYEEADSLVRDQDRLGSRQRKEYIQDQLQRAQLADLRNVLVDMLSSEERSQMLIRGDLPYAARIVEPLQISTQMLFPKTNSVLVPVVVTIALSLALIGLFALFRAE
jgi:hypothetical protein